MKIRLHGTEEELNKYLPILNKVFNVLMQTEPYSDRGKSKYCRVYMDVTFNDNCEYFKEIRLCKLVEDYINSIEGLIVIAQNKILFSDDNEEIHYYREQIQIMSSVKVGLTKIIDSWRDNL